MKYILMAILILIPSISYSADLHFNSTGAVAVASSATMDSSWQVWQVSMGLSAAGGAGSLTVVVNAAAGAAYDYTLDTQDMTAATEYLVRFSPPVKLQPNDSIDVAWANANTRTYGLSIVATESN